MILGVTGHQHIGSANDIAWVRRAMARALAHVPVSGGVTSLAMGADQLLARLLLDRGIPYTVVVPCEGYDATFGAESDLAQYTELLATAAQVVRLGYPAPSEPAFYEAGKAVVSRSDELIAVWDGGPAKGLGGTADVVRYAQTRAVPVIHVNPRDHTVHRI